MKQIRNVNAKFKDSFDVSEKNVFKKIHYFFVSASPGLSDAFYVLAITVVLYYSITRYSSFSGREVEDISTKETAERYSSSLRISLNKAVTKC